MIKIYSTPTCKNCKIIKNYLLDNKFEFQEIDITKDFKAYAELISNGYKTVPVLSINDIFHIGDNENLINYIKGEKQ